jgi:hypothetical protein
MRVALARSGTAHIRQRTCHTNSRPAMPAAYSTCWADRHRPQVQSESSPGWVFSSNQVPLHCSPSMTLIVVANDERVEPVRTWKATGVFHC